MDPGQADRGLPDHGFISGTQRLAFADPLQDGIDSFSFDVLGDHDLFDCVIGNESRDWDADLVELDSADHIDRESLMGFSAVNGREGADKAEMLGPETAGIEEDLYEIEDLFSRGFATAPNLIGIADAS